MWRPIRNGALALLVALAATPAAAQTSADDLAARTADTVYRLAHLFEPPAQSITIPNTFVNGTVADATQVNANFTALSSNAVNRNGGTMLGTLNTRALTPTSDAAYDAGTNVLRFRDGWFSRNGSFGGTLAVTGAVTFTVPLTFANGGTGLATGTSGGILGFTGATTLASSAALAANGVVLGGGAGATPTATAAGNAGQVFAGSGTGGVPSYLGGATLLHAATGTSTAAGATTVDSFALPTTLTALDTLYIYLELESVTQNTAQVNLYDVTDSSAIGSGISPSPLTAGNGIFGAVQLMQRQGTNTAHSFFFSAWSTATAAFVSGGQFGTTVATWGNYTLGLRHGGVTAGGTFKYTWAVYRVAGQ